LTTPFTAYRAPKWLPGGHAQTIYPLLIKAAPPPYRRERWETPDSDFIDLDWMDAPTDASDTQALPLLILFHGLEGSSSSHYATSLMAATKARGWTGVVSHFRGCSGESNRLPRAYHSGDSDEIDWVLRRLRQRHPERPIYVTGVSLGGNALLKWLGEREFLANDVINAAASVCAPLDLAICGHHLGRGFNKVYTHTSSTRSSRRRCMALPAPTTTGGGRRASRGCAGIRLPTLLLNARNDPFLPPTRCLPSAMSASVRLDFPRQGGHVGFVTGSLPGRLDWLPQRILHYFQHEV
jgi:predicted alpha/beta-fold hydrolase